MKSLLIVGGLVSALALSASAITWDVVDETYGSETGQVAFVHDPPFNFGGLYVFPWSDVPIESLSNGLVRLDTAAGGSGSGIDYAVRFDTNTVFQMPTDGTWALEVEKTNIRVNLVNPGATRTGMRAAAMPGEDPMTLATPEDIASVFLDLASPACNSMYARLSPLRNSCQCRPPGPIPQKKALHPTSLSVAVWTIPLPSPSTDATQRRALSGTR